MVSLVDSQFRPDQFLPTQTAYAAEWQQLDERFAGLGGDRQLRRIATGCRWAEGPVYVPSGRYLLWSDIPNDRILRWDELTGEVGVFRSPAGYPNGHTLDHQGRLVSCEHGNRRVTRTELDGRVTVVADRGDGGRLNSPNDVVVARDGAVWFTDPSYGIASDYEGFAAESEVAGCHLYRVDPASGAPVAAVTDFDQPNGLAFSLDESRLYVADSGRGHVREFSVRDGELSGGDVLIDGQGESPDGLRLDSAGRLWVAMGSAVCCYHADGTALGRLPLPEPVANLCFGGPKRNVLFVCATTSVYLLMLKVTGAPPAYAGRG